MSNHIVKRGVLVIVISIFLSIAAANLVNAFGISAPYLDKDILKVVAGEVYYYNLTIQNGDSADYDVYVNYRSTDDIATLEKKIISTPAHTFNNTIIFKITIPKDARIGKSYLLEYNATPSNSGEYIKGLMIKRSLNILVVDPSARYQSDASNTKKASDGFSSKIVFAGIIPSLRIAGKYLIIALIIAVFIFLIIRLWRLSREMSLKLPFKSSEDKSDYTISDAKNLADIRKILEKMSDEEFELEPIKEILWTRISQLQGNARLIDENITRKGLIGRLEKI